MRKRLSASSSNTADLAHRYQPRKEVRAYSLQRYIVGKLREYNDKLFTVLHSFTKKQKNPHLIIEIINSVQLFVVYAFCAYRMVADGMSAGDFMLYSSAVFAFGNSLGNVTNSVISFWHTSSLMTKLTDVLNIEKKLKEKVLYNKELRTINSEMFHLHTPAVIKTPLRTSASLSAQMKKSRSSAKTAPERVRLSSCCSVCMFRKKARFT